MSNTYLFNVETSWEIQAENEEEAYEKIPGGKETEGVRLIDEDIMLVEVIPDKSETPDALP